MDQVLTFDRSNDVSKLEGCNTRGIDYRWSIFTNAISKIPKGCDALDFGAGSLRESFDLVTRGFNVTSVDMDAELLSSYKLKYAWPDNGVTHSVIAAMDIFNGLSRLKGMRFSLITCFDVLEHLEEPKEALLALKELLDDNGLLLITVPNGRTLFELAFHADLLIARKTNRRLRPGEPHLQRNSPETWRRIITNSGLSILDHDMQIGFFANTFAALVQLPLTLGGRVLRKIGLKVDALTLSEKIINARQSAAIDFIDRKTKRVLYQLYGWNLFVVTSK